MTLGLVVRRIGSSRVKAYVMAAVWAVRAAAQGGVVVFLTALLAHPATAADIIAVRMADHGGYTRFVVEVSANLPFVISAVTGPDRLRIDLPEVTWKAPSAETTGTGLVRKYSFDDGAARLVLDLAKPVAVTNAFMLAPDPSHGWRLVVDLAETTPEAFASTQNLRQGSAPDSAVVRPFGESESPGQSVGTEGKSVPPVPQTPLAKGETKPVRPAPLPPKKRTEPHQIQRASASPAAVAAKGPPKGKEEERRPVIVLDPGHGGADPGATGLSGIFEKHITLAMAIELREIFLATNRYRVVLTREDDVFIALRDRVAFARARKADLFVSLHADAIANSEIRGLSVYTLSKEASDQESAALAERENKADLIGGLDLSHESRDVANILIDLVQRETMNHSALLSRSFILELRRAVQLLPKSHRFAGFAVLKAPDIPAILLEMGYLSNPEEEQLLRQPAYRAKLGTALVRAVDHYFKRRKAVQP